MLLYYDDSMLRAHRNDDPQIMMMCSSTFALSRTFAAGDTQMCSHISTGSHRSRDSAEQNNTARSCKRRLRWRRQGRSGRQDFVGRLEDRLCKQRLRLLGHYLFRFRSTRPGQPRTSSRKIETHHQNDANTIMVMVPPAGLSSASLQEINRLRYKRTRHSDCFIHDSLRAK